MRCIVAVVLSAWCRTQAFHGAPRSRDCFSPYDGKPLVKLLPSSELEFEAMKAAIAELGCAHWGDSENRQALFAVCENSSATRLAGLHLHRAEIVTRDTGAHFRQSSGTVTPYETSEQATLDSNFYAAWRSYDDRMVRIVSLVNGMSSSPIENVTVAMEDIGTSFEGRTMKAVRIIGSGDRTSRSKVVLTFQQHAREWIAGMAGVFAVEHTIAKARDDPTWLEDMELVLVPISNPDGFIFTQEKDRMWRKNRRIVPGNGCIGVDLNRNWQPDWNGRRSTSTGPCSEIFVGSAAFSEPEVQALKRLLDEEKVVVHLDIHSYSQLILRPWMYTTELHPRIKEIDELGMLMQDAMAAAPGGTLYGYGGPEMLYAASGIAPDYSSTKGALGFTFELRPSTGGAGGFAPPPAQILPACHESLAGIYTAISWAKENRQPTHPVPSPMPVGPLPPVSPSPTPVSPSPAPPGGGGDDGEQDPPDAFDVPPWLPWALLFGIVLLLVVGYQCCRSKPARRLATPTSIEVAT